jgi:hypothetical protein
MVRMWWRGGVDDLDNNNGQLSPLITIPLLAA